LKRRLNRKELLTKDRDSILSVVWDSPGPLAVTLLRALVDNQDINLEAHFSPGMLRSNNHLVLEYLLDSPIARDQLKNLYIERNTFESIGKSGKSYLFEKLLSLVNPPIEIIRTQALVCAACEGHYDFVLAYLERFPDDSLSEGLLRSAAVLASYDLTYLFLSRIKSPSLDPDALIMCANFGTPAVLHLLVSYGLPLIYLDKALFTSATRRDSVPMVDALLNLGANPKFQNESGVTLILTAAQRGHWNVVKVPLLVFSTYLLKHLIPMSDINAKMPLDNDRPIDFAAASGHFDVVEALIQANTHHGKAMLVAIENQNWKIAHYLLDHGFSLDYPLTATEQGRLIMSIMKMARGDPQLVVQTIKMLEERGSKYLSAIICQIGFLA
jgi:ankyrin repeat protein